ncbi:MAG: gfo/Idh/MocA family oxidoreductase, partial [Clostridiales bacterium]|nr:gfo/Idh/MocA family oxidoreductase [Clostridiales bacterium]
MEATWTLFLPTMLKVRQWIAQGRIGEIRRISADFGFHMDSKTGRVFDYSLGGGALLDLGPYSIGVPYVLLNKTPVSITSNMHIGQTGVDEVDNVILGYEDGICIQGFCSITTSVPSDMHIQGTRGRIFMPSFFTAEKAELYIDGKLEDSFAKQNNGLGFMYEINETMQCIREGKLESDIIPLSTSLAIMEIIDEVRKQGSLIYDND